MAQRKGLLLVFTLLLFTTLLVGCGWEKRQAGAQLGEKTLESQQVQVEEKTTELREEKRAETQSGKDQSQVLKQDLKQSPLNPDQKQPPNNKPAVPQRPLEATFYERRESKGGIEVEITWVTPEYLRARGQKPTPEQERDLTSNLVFNIALTTHAGNLMDFDFVGSTSLKINGQEAGKGTWQLVSADAHHPEGILRFASPVEPIKDLTLIIKGLGGVPERVFKWELP